MAHESTTSLIKNLEKDGFVRLNSLFPPEEVAKAYQEIQFWYEKDLEARQSQQVSKEHWEGPAGKTILTRPSHLMIDAYGKSPTLDRLFEKMLTDPLTRPIIDELTGGNIKLRGFNIRRMTGAYDPPPSHEWHRDSTGEIGFGILLTDVGPGENAATSFVPGSHLFPYCPRWNNLFYSAPSLLPGLWKLSLFNKLLARRVLRNATGGFGRQGDAYIFINDIWHGRQPNLKGQETMVVLIGAFPTDYEFPDRVVPPSEEILSKLPPTVAQVASCRLPANPPKSTILRRMLERRQKTGLFSLWRLAQIERKLFEAVSFVPMASARLFYQHVFKHLYFIYRVFRRVFLILTKGELPKKWTST